MKPFEYTALPSHVLFGAGYLERVAAEAEACICIKLYFFWPKF